MANTVQTNGNGQIQRKGAEKPEDKIGALIQRMAPEIARALPKHVTPERMARVAMTALRTNAKLAACTPVSLIACIMQASQLGLEVNTPLGHAYLIPRKNKGVEECTLLIGYQGLIELSRRSGQLRAIWAFPVYEGDHFKVTYGLSPMVEHEPRFDAPRDPKSLKYVYAAARLAETDEPVFVVLTRAEIEGYRKRGASGRGISTPWDSDYEAMSLKTAVRRLYRWLPKSIEMMTAATVDESTNLRATFSDEVRGTIERGTGLELPDGEPETLDTSDVPEGARHAQPIEQFGKPAATYDTSDQDAPPPDDHDA